MTANDSQFSARYIAESSRNDTRNSATRNSTVYENSRDSNFNGWESEAIAREVIKTLRESKVDHPVPPGRKHWKRINEGPGQILRTAIAENEISSWDRAPTSLYFHFRFYDFTELLLRTSSIKIMKTCYRFVEAHITLAPSVENSKEFMGNVLSCLLPRACQTSLNGSANSILKLVRPG